MKNTLIDAGPLIALFDKDDKYNNAVIEFLKNYKGKLITTWPVITEVSHLLNFNVNVQIDFLKWLRREAINIINIENDYLERIIELTKKYSNVPMDLADSSLVVIAEMTGYRDIATIDSDYYIYRIKDKKFFNNVLSDYLKNK